MSFSWFFGMYSLLYNENECKYFVLFLLPTFYCRKLQHIYKNLVCLRKKELRGWWKETERRRLRWLSGRGEDLTWQFHSDWVLNRRPTWHATCHWYLSFSLSQQQVVPLLFLLGSVTSLLSPHLPSINPSIRSLVFVCVVFMELIGDISPP